MTLSVLSTLLDDEDVDQVRIAVTLKPGKSSHNVDSFCVERAVMKWLSEHTPSWVTYIRDTGMKTLGSEVKPIFSSENKPSA